MIKQLLLFKICYMQFKHVSFIVEMGTDFIHALKKQNLNAITERHL